MNKITPLPTVKKLTTCAECRGSGRTKCPFTECPHGSHGCIGCDESGHKRIEPSEISKDRNLAYTSLVEGIEGMEAPEFSEYDIEALHEGFFLALEHILENVVKPLYSKE